MLARTIVALALVASAAAQLGALTGSLSSGCQSAATGLLTTGFASCAAIISLASVFTTSGSVISPIETWLNAACTTTCSDSDIQSALDVVDKGCASDLEAGAEIAVQIRSAIANYNTEQKALCLQSTSNSSYCATQLLTEVQTQSGTDLSLTNIINLIYNSSNTLSSLTPATFCTDCNHGLISALSSIDSNSTAPLTDVATQACGESFRDGQIPSTVSLKSSNASSASTESTPLGGAGRVGSGALGAAGVALVMGMMTLA